MLYQTDIRHGGDIYSDEIQLDFSSSVNPFGPPQRVIEAIHGAVDLIEHYPDPLCREAVGAISLLEEVPAEFILLGNGAAELIYSYCAALRPKTALEPAPTFSEYSSALNSFGGEMLRYLLDPERMFELDEGFIHGIEMKEPEAIFLCNPNNPTGRLSDPGLLCGILDLCRAKNIRLFIDECFLDLSDRPFDMKKYLSDFPNLLILKALTKNYALSGIRIGYCLSSDREFLRKMSCTVQPWNVSVLAQAAAAAALKEKDYPSKSAGLIRPERERLRSALESLGFLTCPSDANFILFQAPHGLDISLRKKKIAIRNCSNYAGLGPGWYRIAVKRREENEILIEALRQAMEQEA